MELRPHIVPAPTNVHIQVGSSSTSSPQEWLTTTCEAATTGTMGKIVSSLLVTALLATSTVLLVMTLDTNATYP